MKKLLLIAALASLSVPAFASKARLAALGNADHLVDIQTTFTNPAQLLMLGDYLTFEMGPTNVVYNANTTPPTMPANTAGAEGGFTRSQGDAKWGVYLGNKSDFVNVLRDTLGFKKTENSIDFQYARKGSINWGVAFNLSQSDTKSSSVALGPPSVTTPAQKQNAYATRFGAYAGDWEAYAILGLVAEATGSTGLTVASGATPVYDPNATLKGTAAYKIGGAYKMDHLYYYAKYYSQEEKYSSTVMPNAAMDGTKFAQSQMDVGVVDHTKIDGGEWFYGMGLRSFESKHSGAAMATLDSKTTATSLPFLLGMEYDATSWMTLRASLSQNVILGSTKTETSVAGETDTIADNTTVATGIGLKMNKWTLDGTWAAQTAGNVNTTSFMTNASLTYVF